MNLVCLFVLKAAFSGLGFGVFVCFIKPPSQRMDLVIACLFVI